MQGRSFDSDRLPRQAVDKNRPCQLHGVDEAGKERLQIWYMSVQAQRHAMSSRCTFVTRFQPHPAPHRFRQRDTRCESLRTGAGGDGDATAQRQGVGRAAVQAMLDRFAAEPDCHEAALSYVPENLVARSLDAALGFVEGDEWADDEVVARRPV